MFGARPKKSPRRVASTRSPATGMGDDAQELVAGVLVGAERKDLFELVDDEHRPAGLSTSARASAVGSTKSRWCKASASPPAARAQAAARVRKGSSPGADQDEFAFLAARRCGRQPARTTEDLPEPEDPTTATKACSVKAGHDLIDGPFAAVEADRVVPGEYL